MDSNEYQQATLNRPIQHQSQQKTPLTSVPKAYVYTEIENRPPANTNIPHPPLQTVYPAAIQNNVESRIIHRPAPVRKYGSSQIPSSLPSIVHEPSNTVAAIQNIPSTFTQYAHSYSSSPVTTSSSPSSSSLPSASSSQSFTSTNSEIYSHQNSNTREKIVVKVVKAPGWYLNDANERRSYFDAVAHGLLSENGLVYVNNVQKENVPSNAQTSQSNAAYLPNNRFVSSLSSIPPSQPQSIYPPRVAQPSNFLNYCPCADNSAIATSAYSQLIKSQPFHGSQQLPQIKQYPAQTRQLSFKKRSAIEGDRDPYSGPSSYNVGQQSVGRLIGDNLKYQYNLSSLRQYPSQIQSTQRHQ